MTGDGGSHVAEAAPDIDGERFFKGVLRHRLVVLAATVIGGSVALSAALLATPQYVSSTTLFFSADGRSDPGAAYTGGLFAQQRVQSYAALVVQPRVAEDVVAQLDLDLSATQVRQRLDATAEPESVLLSITARDEQPSRSRAIADAAGRAVSSIVSELDRGAADGAALIRASVVQPAQQPTSPASPLPARDTALGAALGLIVGVAYAAARTAGDRTVRSAEAVRQRGLAVLATVPARHRRVWARRKRDRQSASRTAPYRQVRAVLRLGRPEAAAESLLVVGLGATTGAADAARELALVTGRADASVVLVDCDVRTPRRGGRPRATSGLSTVLLRNEDPLTLLRTLDSETGASVLPSGPVPPAGSELFASAAMGEVIALLQSWFDVVVLTCASLEDSDALAIAPLVDGVLLVVQQGTTTLGQLSETADVLAAVDGRPLGVLLLEERIRGRASAGPPWEDLPQDEPQAKALRPRRTHAPGRSRVRGAKASPIARVGRLLTDS